MRNAERQGAGELNYISQEATGAPATPTTPVTALATLSSIPPQGARRRVRSLHWCSSGGSNPPDRPAEPRPLHPALVEPKRHSPLPLCSREPRDQLGSCDSRAWRLKSVTLATAGPPPQTVRESGEFRSKGRWGVDTCFPLGSAGPRLCSDPLLRALVSGHSLPPPRLRCGRVFVFPPTPEPALPGAWDPLSGTRIWPTIWGQDLNRPHTELNRNANKGEEVLPRRLSILTRSPYLPPPQKEAEVGAASWSYGPETDADPKLGSLGRLGRLGHCKSLLRSFCWPSLRPRET